MPCESFEIQVDRDGQSTVVREGLADRDVSAILKELGDGSNVTVTISSNLDGRLILAICGSRAFVGLDRADGLFQYVANDHRAGAELFTIGGQEVSLDSRYDLSLTDVVFVVDEWMRKGEDMSRGAWERQ